MIKLALFTFMLYSLTTQVKCQVLSWKKISQVNLVDASGSPAKLEIGKSTVLIMLSPECPLCRNYAPVLNELQKRYPEVSFYGIFPGKGYEPKEVNNFKNEYQLTLTSLIDPQKKLSQYLNATTTPECIFINRMGVVIYRGLIDNWPSGLGQKRKVITEKYLATALERTKSGKTFAITQTKPIGCLINDL